MVDGYAAASWTDRVTSRRVLRVVGAGWSAAFV